MAVAVSYRTSQSLQRKSAMKGKVDVSAAARSSEFDS